MDGPSATSLCSSFEDEVNISKPPLRPDQYIRARQPSSPTSPPRVHRPEAIFPFRNFEYSGWELCEAEAGMRRGYFRVMALVDGEGFDAPPVGWDVWLVDGDEDKLRQAWVHHGRRMVTGVYPDVERTDVLPDYLSYDERLGADRRYWSFVDAHPGPASALRKAT
ncbi:hypothetical protein OF83DRAFT_1177888 [Amylostereum chailletii]|nr:hypothetical protein OF83DRAFT_1180139 [Amylostereum chailletii]KAI0311112.1 hypothetical protein OF83DRAFT_1177888 [Amylostereum chailletii]